MKFVAGTSTKGAKKSAKVVVDLGVPWRLLKSRCHKEGRFDQRFLHDKGCWLSLIFPGLVVSLFLVGNSKG